MKRNVARQIRLGLALLVLVGCAHSKPDWIKNSRAYLDERAFYGVGSTTGIRIKSKLLAQITAEDMAKGEASKIFENYSLFLLKEYTKSLTDQERAIAEEEGALSISYMTHVGMALFEVVQKDIWVDPEKGTYHALARIKLKHLLREIDSAEDLSPELQNFVRKNAEDAFDRFQGLNEAKFLNEAKSEDSLKAEGK